MSNSLLIVPLPSLVHRIGGEAVKKARALASQYQCQLKRVRRSRNWQLSGEAMRLDELCNQLDRESELKYLKQKTEQKLQLHPELLETKAAKLRRLIENDPTITLAELVALTQCTLSEARAARLNEDDF
ncbi:ribosome recycling factor family protein [Veronia pacifica]|uniref:Ribosome recycling factor n=1 Tax=Veronia pacifica TaxID=1080227 RepID=A0A1C3ED58_9GAMM|nr:ribosome recycling factor family protein [Veronia pacifica]ODA31171.1 ribosome recycling factor [Veronia pacifica]